MLVAGDEDEYVDEEDDSDEELETELARLEETFGDLIKEDKKKQPDGKVVPLFGEKKGKKK